MKTLDEIKSELDEGIIGAVGKGIKKVASPVTNRLTTTGRAKIAQKKIDKHNTKVQQKDTIAKANAAGKSAFGLTQKSRAANAKKKLDKIAQKKAAQDTIARAKQLKKGVTAGMEYEGKKMDSAAMKKAMDVFKKRGGKIKKVAPGKAAGYHGKDDPGANMHGMMDRGDTKGFNRKKKVKSMGREQVDEISKKTAGSYIKKASDNMSRQADKMARAQRADGPPDKAVNKFVNRRTGIARAVNRLTK